MSLQKNSNSFERDFKRLLFFALRFPFIVVSFDFFADEFKVCAGVPDLLFIETCWLHTRNVQHHFIFSDTCTPQQRFLPWSTKNPKAKV